MSCGISSGISINCDDLRKVGGVNKRVFLFNISNLQDDKYTIDSDGYVTAINFDSYGGLYEITSDKFSHSGGYSAQVQEGGNTFFQHEVTMKAFSDTPAEDEVIQDLAVADVGVIVETNSQEFILYGAENGLRLSEGSQNTGTTFGSDITDTITLQGGETTKPKRVFDTDYTTTKTYLEGLVL